MANSTTGTASFEFIPAKKLMIFLVEEDKHSHEPMSLAILRLIREGGLAGATVIKAVEGFGARRIIHTSVTEISSLNLPITIEAIDLPEKIDEIIPQIADVVTSGLVEVSRTFILRPRSTGDKGESTQGEKPC